MSFFGVELKWLLFTSDSLNFPPSIALRWFSEYGCQGLVHRDEDPDVLLESIYKEGLCSGKMLDASKYSMFHIQFLLFYYISRPSG